MTVNKFSGMEQSLDAASQLLKSMASPHRLMILCMLAEGETSVSDLAAALEIRQPTVSQHLTRLRLDQLVTTRRDGQTVYYRLTEGPAEAIIQILHDAYCTDPDAKRRGTGHPISS
ncbi:MAG: ArsR/SmtB family transcription factor [Alphaproteobacteria bacterium]